MRCYTVNKCVTQYPISTHATHNYYYTHVHTHNTRYIQCHIQCSSSGSSCLIKSVHTHTHTHVWRHKGWYMACTFVHLQDCYYEFTVGMLCSQSLNHDLFVSRLEGSCACQYFRMNRMIVYGSCMCCYTHCFGWYTCMCVCLSACTLNCPLYSSCVCVCNVMWRKKYNFSPQAIDSD